MPWERGGGNRGGAFICPGAAVPRRFDAFNGREKTLASSCTCLHRRGNVSFRSSEFPVFSLGDPPWEYLQSRKLSPIRVPQFFSPASLDSTRQSKPFSLWPGRACVIVALTGLIPLSPIGTWLFGNLHKRGGFREDPGILKVRLWTVVRIVIVAFGSLAIDFFFRSKRNVVDLEIRLRG